MKIFAFWTGAPYMKSILEEFEKQGHEITDRPSEDCDLHICLQMGDQNTHNALIDIKKRFPDVPFFTYVWDCYEWITNPRHDRGYDWSGLGRVCNISEKVFVPSEGQRYRCLQHWGVGLEKTKSIPAYAPFFEHQTLDLDYVCDPLRAIPDRHAGWAERACSELNIPYQHGGRGKDKTIKDWDEYKQWIANSSFVICPWYEASTGGMSLVEAYYIGKEVLICNSPYMGAKDYFGDRANYFKPTYESMKESLQKMWEERPSRYSLKDRRKFCERFSLENFCKNIIKEIDK